MHKQSSERRVETLIATAMERFHGNAAAGETAEYLHFIYFQG